MNGGMTNDPNAAGGLDALCARPVRCKLSSGETVEVAPIKVRQLAAVVRAAEPVIGALAGVAALPPASQGGAFAALLVEQLDDVVALVAALTGRTVEWVQDLDLDDLAAVAGAALEVNASFFVRRLRPSIEALGATMTRSLGALAPTPTPDGLTSRPS